MGESYIKGLDQFMRMTNKIPEELEEDVKRLVKESTLIVEADVINTAPVGESRKGYTGGRLKQSISVKFKNDGLIGIVSAQTEYVLFVEFGTRYQKAQLFMTRAYQKEKPKFEKKLKQLLKRVGD